MPIKTTHSSQSLCWWAAWRSASESHSSFNLIVKKDIFIDCVWFNTSPLGVPEKKKLMAVGCPELSKAMIIYQCLLSDQSPRQRGTEWRSPWESLKLIWGGCPDKQTPPPVLWFMAGLRRSEESHWVRRETFVGNSDGVWLIRSENMIALPWDKATTTIKRRKTQHRDYPGGPVVKNPPCNSGDLGSIPSQGTKIPYALEPLSPSAPTPEPKYRN